MTLLSGIDAHRENVWVAANFSCSYVNLLFTSRHILTIFNLLRSTIIDNKRHVINDFIFKTYIPKQETHGSRQKVEIRTLIAVTLFTQRTPDKQTLTIHTFIFKPSSQVSNLFFLMAKQKMLHTGK